MSDEKKNWDFKQIGTGAGGSLLVLFFLQDQGIQMMNKHQDSSNRVIIEKTIANSQRIKALEDSMKNFDDKLSKGFDNIREQSKRDMMDLRQFFERQTDDRYTRSEHNEYARNVDSRMNERARAVDLRLKLIEARIFDLNKKGK